MAQQQLFNKIFYAAQSTGDVPLALKNIIIDHPYFGLAHFFYLKNLDENVTNFADRAAQTALFFKSPFCLQALLKHDNTSEFVKTELDSLEKNVVTTATIPETFETSETKATKITKEETAILPGVENTTQKNEYRLLFEPLHASDYFASQGIKLSSDALGGDKLGKQLKSFTAWLKTMKKVNADKLLVVSASAEIAVKMQAEKSNVEEEVVTEPMADAYTIQNKREKAIDIYNKLSLLNPAKSAYFAAKIDYLK